jgi:AP-1-like factor
MIPRSYPLSSPFSLHYLLIEPRREDPFLERDEPLVEDVEAEIAACQQKWKSNAEESERLRQQLQNTATENELLKATSTYNSGEAKSIPTSPTPIRYSPKDSYTEVLRAYEKKPPSDRIVTTERGERLSAEEAWSYISQHARYNQGSLGLGDISEMIKLVSRCDGTGPVFEERDITLAIERSVRADSGDLI